MTSHHAPDPSAFSPTFAGHDMNPSSSDQLAPVAPLALAARALLGACALSMGAVLAWPTATQAQTTLPAGLTPGAAQAAERQQREAQEREERLQQGAPDASVTAPAAPKPSAASTERNIRVERFEVDASQILSAEEVDAVLAPLRGQTVSLADLQAAVARINERYDARRALTARAVLPTQTIQDGVVRIRLIEAKTGDVRISGQQALADGYVRDRLHLSQDALLSVPALEEDLAKFNRLNETQLRANVVPGQRFGTTDVEITVSEPKRLRADLFADNAGRETTGRGRVGVALRGSNWLADSDTASLTATTARGSNSLAGSYSLPLNRHDTRLDLSASYGDIRILRGAFQPLEITGRSQDATIGVSQPLVTEAQRAWSTYARVSDRQSRSSFSGFKQTHEKHRVMTFGLAGDQLTDGHAWFLDQQLVVGSTDLAGDASFMYYRAQGNRLDRLGERTQLISRAALQLSQNRLLPSGEQFQVGGAYTVRSYSEGLVSGRHGYQLSVEIRQGLGAIEYLEREPNAPRWQWLAFIDHGAAIAYRPGNLQAVQRDDFLTSAGVGIVMDWRNVNARLVLAAPLKRHHPAETDRSDVRVHAYVNVALQ